MTITLAQMKEIIALFDKIGIPYDYFSTYNIYEEIIGHILEIGEFQLDTDEIDDEDRKYNQGGK